MATYPEVWQVANGTVYGPNDNDFTGNLMLPEQYAVSNGTQYGGNGTDFTGNLMLPEAWQVENGTTFGGNGGADHTGNMILPDVGDVRSGVTYGGNGTDLNGTFAANGSGPYVIAPGPLGEITSGGTLRFWLACFDGFGAPTNAPEPSVYGYKDGNGPYVISPAVVNNGNLVEVALSMANTTLFSTGSQWTLFIDSPFVVAGIDVAPRTIASFTVASSSSSSSSSSGGSSGMLTLPPGPALASFAPITLPSASTSITALLTANNLTIPTGTIALVLQVQAESMKIDRAGGNATSNGTVIGANQTLVLSKSGNDDYSLGTPHVVRGASGATVQITCH